MKWLRLLACISLLAIGQGGAAAEPPKVLRYAFNVAETGFDPAQVSDIYSRIVTSHIFEAPIAYDHLARPYKLKPDTAAAMPESSDDFKTWTIRIRPGIYFADDPAFNGRRRELTAADYVYTYKRIYDPKVKAPGFSELSEEGILGLREVRDAALKQQKPFDYDREVEGLKAIDRYTLRIKLKEPRPRLLFTLAQNDIYGAVAREVVEAYGEHIMEHPVGTGPFKLVQWRRSSLIVLERNPGFREQFYDAEPNADDAEGQALLRRFKGRRLPMIDRVEVSIIEEPQPRWLSFLNGEQNFLWFLPPDFTMQAVPNGKLAPALAKRGMRAYTVAAADVYLLTYNMEHPLVGGNAPEKVALRRAMNLAYDVEREVKLVRRGLAVPAQTILPPLTEGHDPRMRTEATEYSPAKARALLDLYGYVDHDGDGWRDMPDGSPLVLEMSTQSDQFARQLDELWKLNMNAVGLKVVLKIAQWPENLKNVRAGKFMVWRVGSTASTPDGQGALERAYGPSVGRANLARFHLEEFDRLYERMKLLPDGPQRDELFRRTAKLLVAYAPYRMMVHRVLVDMAHPGVEGYRRGPFWLDWWQYVDVERERP